MNRSRKQSDSLEVIRDRDSIEANMNMTFNLDFLWSRLCLCFSMGTLLLLSACLSEEVDPCDPDYIYFRDHQIEDAVRDELGVYGRDLTEADAHRVSHLSLSNRELESLIGLECLSNLKTLEMSRSGVQDLSPLEELSELQSLDLSYNDLLDLEPIQAKEELRELNLEGTNLSRSKLVVLSSLQDLEVLNLAANDLDDSDIQILSDLEGLQKLDLSRNKLAEPKALRELKLRDLDLRSNELEGVSELSSMTDLSTLNLASNRQLVRVDGLRNLHQLVELDLSQTGLMSLSGVVELEKLTRLDLTDAAFECRTESDKLDSLEQSIVVQNSGELIVGCERDCAKLWGGLSTLDICGVCDDDPSNDHAFEDSGLLSAVTETVQAAGVDEVTNEALLQITELSADEASISSLAGIECLANLKSASFYQNQISDLSPLAELEQLEVLSVANNQVEELASLAGLEQLTRLNLQNNKVEDLDALESLTGLSWLDLSENKLRDISPLGELGEMQHLNLHDNNIYDISPIESMSGLEELFISDNNVELLTTLSVMDKLEVLDASGNQIDDLTPLLSIKSFVFLFLQNNPFDCGEENTLDALNQLHEQVVVQNKGSFDHDCK